MIGFDMRFFSARGVAVGKGKQCRERREQKNHSIFGIDLCVAKKSSDTQENHADYAQNPIGHKRAFDQVNRVRKQGERAGEGMRLSLIHI